VGKLFGAVSGQGYAQPAGINHIPPQVVQINGQTFTTRGFRKPITPNEINNYLAGQKRIEDAIEAKRKELQKHYGEGEKRTDNLRKETRLEQTQDRIFYGNRVKETEAAYKAARDEVRKQKYALKHIALEEGKRTLKALTAQSADMMKDSRLQFLAREAAERFNENEERISQGDQRLRYQGEALGMRQESMNHLENQRRYQRMMGLSAGARQEEAAGRAATAAPLINAQRQAQADFYRGLGNSQNDGTPQAHSSVLTLGKIQQIYPHLSPQQLQAMLDADKMLHPELYK